MMKYDVILPVAHRVSAADASPIPTDRPVTVTNYGIKIRNFDILEQST